MWLKLSHIRLFKKFHRPAVETLFVAETEISRSHGEKWYINAIPEELQ